MTEMYIIKRLFHWIDDRKFPFQICNAFIYNWECDYWAMTQNGETREFEIKTSRTDYFNDAKKDKHKIHDGANYFYYVTPKDLITKEEVDKSYGLIYIWETGFVEVAKKPRRLNQNQFEQWQMLANKTYWRFRQLWKEKYIANKITHDEYIEGFNISLMEEEKHKIQNI